MGQVLNNTSGAPAGKSEGACPACGAAESRTLFAATDRLYHATTKTFSIVECRRCRLLRLSPWPDPAELRGYYPDNYWYVPEMEAAGKWVERYRRMVLRDHTRFVGRVLRECGAKGPILDVGCGGGLFLRLMAERGLPVFGLDFCLQAASVALTQNGVPAVCGSLSHAPFLPGGFAVVTMFHVLEHLYDPAAYLQSAHALLKSDGRLIVQVPNAQCWQFLLLGENWIGLDVPRHLLTFRPRELELLLDQCGFEVLRTKYFSLRDNPAGMATSLAPWLDPMARRIRRVTETPNMRLFKDLVYFALTAACLPFAMLEAACHAGSTVMVEARRKS